MTRVGQVALGVLLLLGACRRTHETPVYETATPPAAPSAEPQVAAPEVAAAPASGQPAPTSAAGPAAGAPKMPDGGTLNGDPRGLRPGDHARVTAAALPRIQACLDAAELPAGDLPVTVHYAIEPPGYTGAVAVTANAPKEARDCVQAVVAGLQFGEFRGGKVEQDWSFTYHKTIQQVKRGGEGGAAADAGAAR